MPPRSLEVSSKHLGPAHPSTKGWLLVWGPVVWDSKDTTKNSNPFISSYGDRFGIPNHRPQGPKPTGPEPVADHPQKKNNKQLNSVHYDVRFSKPGGGSSLASLPMVRITVITPAPNRSLLSTS